MSLSDGKWCYWHISHKVSNRPSEMFRNMVRFQGEELLAHHPNPNLQDHPLLSVRDCLSNIFAAALHNRRPEEKHNSFSSRYKVDSSTNKAWKSKYMVTCRYEHAGKNRNRKACNKSFLSGEEFRYLRAILTNPNFIYLEIKSRWKPRNACCRSCKVFCHPVCY